MSSESAEDRMLGCRYELKYLVNAGTADAIEQQLNSSTAGQAGDLASSASQGEKKTEFLWELPRESKPVSDDMKLFDLNEKKKSYRAVWARHQTPQGDINVLIAHPSSFEQRRLNELLMMIGVIGGGMLLVVILLAPLVARVAITPIAATAAKLSQVTHQNLGQEHLADVQTPAELAPFVNETAQLLARLDKAIQQQKQFTSDASHELRTPLSLAQSSLELARSKTRTVEEYQRAIRRETSARIRTRRRFGRRFVVEAAFWKPYRQRTRIRTRGQHDPGRARARVSRGVRHFSPRRRWNYSRRHAASSLRPLFSRGAVAQPKFWWRRVGIVYRP